MKYKFRAIKLEKNDFSENLPLELQNAKASNVTTSSGQVTPSRLSNRLGKYVVECKETLFLVGYISSTVNLMPSTLGLGANPICLKLYVISFQHQLTNWP